MADSSATSLEQVGAEVVEKVSTETETTVACAPSAAAASADQVVVDTAAGCALEAPSAAPVPDHDPDIIRWPDEPPPPPDMWAIEPRYDWEREERGYIFEERLESAAKHKEEGNKHFRAEEWELALRRYKRAIYCCHFDEMQMYDLMDQHKETAHDIQVPCKLNLTACIVRMHEEGHAALPEGSLGHAEEAIEHVLKARPKEPKAFFRKGQLLMLQGDLAGARAALDEAAKLGGGSRVRDAYVRLSKLAKEERQRQRELYGGKIQPSSVHKVLEERESRRLGRRELARRALRYLTLPLVWPLEMLFEVARMLVRRALGSNDLHGVS